MHHYWLAGAGNGWRSTVGLESTALSAWGGLLIDGDKGMDMRSGVVKEFVGLEFVVLHLQLTKCWWRYSCFLPRVRRDVVLCMVVWKGEGLSDALSQRAWGNGW